MDMPVQIGRRLTRHDLYELVWIYPLSNLANVVDRSDVALGQICRRFKIPTPGRGHWTKFRSGRKTRRRPKLSIVDHNAEVGLEVKQWPPAKDAATIARYASGYRRKAERREIPIGEPKPEPHKAASEAAALAASFKLDRAKSRRERSLADRIARLVSDCAYAIEPQGVDFTPMPTGFVMANGEDRVELVVFELGRNVPHVPTEAELSNPLSVKKIDYVPTGRLRIELRPVVKNLQSRWSDTSTRRLDRVAHLVAIGADRHFKHWRQWRAGAPAREAERKRIEAEQRAAEIAAWEKDRADRERRELEIRQRRFVMDYAARLGQQRALRGLLRHLQSLPRDTLPNSLFEKVAQELDRCLDVKVIRDEWLRIAPPE